MVFLLSKDFRLDGAGVDTLISQEQNDPKIVLSIILHVYMYTQELRFFHTCIHAAPGFRQYHYCFAESEKNTRINYNKVGTNAMSPQSRTVTRVPYAIPVSLPKKVIWSHIRMPSVRDATG